MKDITVFEKESNLHESTDVGMYYCGKRVRSLNHTYGPQIRICYMFVLVNEGEATFFHRNGNVTLRAHDLLVMCPGERVHYRANTPWSIQWIGLYGGTVEKYMKQLGINGDNPIIHIEKYYEMEKLLDETYRLFDTRFEYAKCEQISLIYRFFSLLLQSSGQRAIVDIAENAKRTVLQALSRSLTTSRESTTLFAPTAESAQRSALDTSYGRRRYTLRQRKKKLLRWQNNINKNYGQLVEMVLKYKYSISRKKTEGRLYLPSVF